MSAKDAARFGREAAFMMNSQELETAHRLGVNLVVLILQDNAYGMIRWKQAVDGFVDYGMTFGNPDFVAYAGAYGIKGSRMNNADGLASALEAAFIWLWCRLTTRRTRGYWWTSCAPALSRKEPGHDRGRPRVRPRPHRRDRKRRPCGA
jgi:TPP-dependent trihydroxycyclohexane-1,2-dione (THcHDO) dehydratase